LLIGFVTNVSYFSNVQVPISLERELCLNLDHTESLKFSTILESKKHSIVIFTWNQEIILTAKFASLEKIQSSLLTPKSKSNL